MKTVTIIGAEEVKVPLTLAPWGRRDVVATGPEKMSVSDGYHTFDELYDHRVTLFIALCRTFEDWINTEGDFGLKERSPWRSKLHSDGSCFEGWFILGMGKKWGKQVTYHLPLARWDETSFAETLETAPEWDGHTPEDVLERLKTI